MPARLERSGRRDSHRKDSGTTRMSPTLDAVATRFIACAAQSSVEGLDIGCGSGLVAIEALERGARLVAIDPDESYILRLLDGVRAANRERLRTEVARVPNVDFEPGRFGAVHVARVLQNLTPDDLALSLRKIATWIAPNGRLFISAFAPDGERWRCFNADYEQHVAKGERWPGYIGSFKDQFLGWNDTAPSMHLLDERILGRELVSSGFALEEFHHYRLPWDDGLTCCGIVAFPLARSTH